MGRGRELGQLNKMKKLRKSYLELEGGRAAQSTYFRATKGGVYITHLVSTLCLRSKWTDRVLALLKGMPEEHNLELELVVCVDW